MFQRIRISLCVLTNSRSDFFLTIFYSETFGKYFWNSFAEAFFTKYSTKNTFYIWLLEKITSFNQTGMLDMCKNMLSAKTLALNGM